MHRQAHANTCPHTPTVTHPLKIFITEGSYKNICVVKKAMAVILSCNAIRDVPVNGILWPILLVQDANVKTFLIPIPSLKPAVGRGMRNEELLKLLHKLSINVV